MIGLAEFWNSDFGYEDLIQLQLRIQMLNDNMLKPTNEICLKCKYQLKMENHN